MKLLPPECLNLNLSDLIFKRKSFCFFHFSDIYSSDSEGGAESEPVRFSTHIPHPHINANRRHPTSTTLSATAAATTTASAAAASAASAATMSEPESKDRRLKVALPPPRAKGNGDYAVILEISVKCVFILPRLLARSHVYIRY